MIPHNRDWVASSLDFSHQKRERVFESVIRVMGGLLSAYDLTKDSLYFEKAREFGRKILPVRAQAWLALCLANLASTTRTKTNATLGLPGQDDALQLGDV